MRLAIAARPAWAVWNPRGGWGWVAASALAVALGVAAANLTHDRFFHKDETKPGAADAKAAEKPGAEGKTEVDPKTTVVMPEGKFEKAKIRVEPVTEIELPRELAFAGKIEADPQRRVEIRPKAPGVVRKVVAAAGARVEKGETLAVLDSPEVGAARLLVRERQRALATVRVDAAWKAELAANTAAVIDRLRKGASAQDLEREFKGKPLGKAKEALMQAYADLEIASHEQEKQTELRKEKITGEHLLFVAQHTREAAQGKFDGTLEAVGFDVAQQDRVARQAVLDAEGMVVDAAQRLHILGVEEDVRDLLAHPERASALPSGSEDLTAYPIIAPFDGTILSTLAVVSRRVDVADTLYTLVDASKVFAVAYVRESDFSRLPELAKGEVRVTVEGLPGRVIKGRMLYTGGDVDPTTRTVRLVAEADNPDGALRPEMFAQIVLDSATTERVPTVPAGAIVQHDGKPAVFVPGDGERTFVVRPVKLGREALGRQVVVEGLKPGDKVVAAGTFLVESELVLQNEAEED